MQLIWEVAGTAKPRAVSGYQQQFLRPKNSGQRCRKTSASVALQGTLPDFEKAGTQTIAEGAFSPNLKMTPTKTLRVGSKVADDFFKVGSPVGQTIKIAAEEYRVVGGLQPARAISLYGWQ